MVDDRSASVFLIIHINLYLLWNVITFIDTGSHVITVDVIGEPDIHA